MTFQAAWDRPVDREVLRGKALAFKALHLRPEILILPNAWDVGTALVFADAGFPAVATTSAGVAFAQGYPDGEKIPRAEMVAVAARIAAMVALPVTADLEAGYGPGPEDVAETVRLAIGAGLVGANFEDRDPRPGGALFEFSHAVERIRAAREAADAEGIPFVINARTDPYLVDREGGPAVFDEAVRRANGYRAAGADCLFVPGKLDLATIGRLAGEIEGPLNVLGAYSGVGGPPLADLQAAGVARVSIGGSLCLTMLTRVRQVARELLDHGTFGYAEGGYTNAELNRMLGG